MSRFAVDAEDFDAVVARLRGKGVRVIMPDDPDRAVVVDVLMLAHIAAPGWSRAHTADRVSVAFPALPSPLPELLTLAGVALAPFSQLGAAGVAALVRLTEKHTISFSPHAIETYDVWSAFHEESHLLQTDAGGGLIHGLRYAASKEYRMLAAEGPAYACNLMGSDDREATARAIAEGLRAYGADDALVADAHAQLGVHVRTLGEGLCPTVRALIDGVRFLRSRGVKDLPELPEVA